MTHVQLQKFPRSHHMMYIQPFPIGVDLNEITCLREVSITFAICTYCIFTLSGLNISAATCPLLPQNCHAPAAGSHSLSPPISGNTTYNSGWKSQVFIATIKSQVENPTVYWYKSDLQL